MNDAEIRGKYGLKNVAHGVILFIQMILVLAGFALGIVQYVNGVFDLFTCIEICLCYLALVGYACYGYRFSIISVQIVILLVATINAIGVISALIGGAGAVMIPGLIINILAFAAAIVMKKSFRISQVLLGLCFALDFAQLVARLITEPGNPFLYYSLQVQFVILDSTLLLINYSYHQRALIRGEAVK